MRGLFVMKYIIGIEFQEVAVLEGFIIVGTYRI